MLRQWLFPANLSILSFIDHFQRTILAFNALITINIICFPFISAYNLCRALTTMPIFAGPSPIQPEIKKAFHYAMLSRL